MSKPSSPLESALEEARAALGSKDDVQRLRDKLGELPPVTTAAGSSASTAHRMSAAMKLTLGALAILLMMAGAFTLVQRSPNEQVSELPLAQPHAAPQILAPPSAPAPVTHEAHEGSRVILDDAQPSTAVEPKLEATRRKPQVAALAVEEPAPANDAPTTPKELQLLMSAQDALEASPQRALGLLDEHLRFYPNGNFALERESLAIDALRKLGRVSTAQARARAFIARFPQASNTKHLQRWLDESDAADHKPEEQPLPTP